MRYGQRHHQRFGHRQGGPSFPQQTPCADPGARTSLQFRARGAGRHRQRLLQADVRPRTGRRAHRTRSAALRAVQGVRHARRLPDRSLHGRPRPRPNAVRHPGHVDRGDVAVPARHARRAHALLLCGVRHRRRRAHSARSDPAAAEEVGDQAECGGRGRGDQGHDRHADEEDGPRHGRGDLVRGLWRVGASPAAADGVLWTVHA